MIKELNNNWDFNVSVKSLTAIGFGMATVISMWFMLKADIAEAKELPKPIDPDITRVEIEMKDQLILQTIISTQEDVSEIKKNMQRIEDKIDKLWKQ